MEVYLNYESASFSRRKDRRIAVHHEMFVRHRTADRAPIEQSRVCLSRSIGPRPPPYFEYDEQETLKIGLGGKQTSGKYN